MKMFNSVGMHSVHKCVRTDEQAARKGRLFRWGLRAAACISNEESFFQYAMPYAIVAGCGCIAIGMYEGKK